MWNRMYTKCVCMCTLDVIMACWNMQQTVVAKVQSSLFIRRSTQRSGDIRDRWDKRPSPKRQNSSLRKTEISTTSIETRRQIQIQEPKTSSYNKRHHKMCTFFINNNEYIQLYCYFLKTYCKNIFIRFMLILLLWNYANFIFNIFRKADKDP